MKMYKSPITEITELDPQTRIMDGVLTTSSAPGTGDPSNPVGVRRRVF